MKIAVTEIEKWERDRFGELAEKHEIHFTAEELTPDNADEFSDADIVSTFIYSDLGAETLRRFENLKMISSRSTGFDHIDLETCRERDITVSTVPSYGKNTVAEHTFGLLLAISHRLVEASDRTRRGDFNSRGLQGFDLMGKTIGVVGTGDIGRYVIRIAKGFGMEVLAYDVEKDEEAARELEFEYVELERLLSESDVVTLHVPANSETEGMIGSEQFETMKDGAVLLNTARGSLVDTRALVRALTEGGLAGAGLDVLAAEPVIREEAEVLRAVYREQHGVDILLADQIIPRLSNVVVTPHSAFNTREAVGRIVDTTVDNIRGFIEGEPRNTVDLSQ